MASIPALDLNRPPTRGAARARLVTPPGERGQGWGGDAGAGRLRNRALILLRWLTILGQVATLLIVGLGLKRPIPWTPCIVLIASAVGLNLALTITRAGQRTATPREITAQLGFDVIQLSGLLFLTGGVVNPFCLLLVAPVTVGAATLPARHSLALWGLTVAAALVLSATSMPMPWPAGEVLILPPIYRAGCALAVIVGVTFCAANAYRGARQAARMELALQVTETVLAREQRLSALGGLAAAAAHELGTPLATIAIVARELARGAGGEAARDDAALLVEQAQRCRDILRRLAETPEAGDAVFARTDLTTFIDEVAGPFAGAAGVRVVTRLEGPAGAAPPALWRRPELRHAMNAIVENAIDFARGEVVVTGRFDAVAIELEVTDDGPGFSAEILTRLGEPYVTSRPGGEASRTGHIGMGLGFFIAKTLLERTGARVAYYNGRRGGAHVNARWPRAQIEAPPETDPLRSGPFG